MLWLRKFFKNLFSSIKVDNLNDIVIYYDEVDMILYEKPVK